MDPATETKLRELNEAGYVAQVQAFAKSVCAPVFLTRRDDMFQGSMTLTTGESGFLGVTAGHVADAMADSDCTFSQVGKTRLEPGSLIHRSKEWDLASFGLAPDTVAASGHLAYTVRAWPLPSLTAGDFVLAGGYPGKYRRHSSGEINVAFVWFAGRLQTVSDNNLGLSLEIGSSICTGDERVAEHEDLGGCSGGPVFRLTETRDSGGMRADFELAGIIYEYSPTWELLLAHPLAPMSGSGRFRA